MPNPLQNIKDLIEELDEEYPRIKLTMIGTGLWKINASDDGRPVGLLFVKIASDGNCAKVVVNHTGGIMEFPRMEAVIDVPNLSDEQERGKVSELLAAVRDKVFL